MTPPLPKNQPKLSFLKKSEKDPNLDLETPSPATPNRPKRSAADLSPIEPEKSPKMSKLELKQMTEQMKEQSELMKEQMKAIQNLTEGQSGLKMKIVTECQFIASSLTKEVTEIKTRQDEETAARLILEQKVTELQTQYGSVSAKLDNLVVKQTDPTEVARVLLPQVTQDLSGQMKLHTDQVRKTYYQSLVTEIKQHETGLMIYGFKPDGSPDLAKDISTNLFNNKMGLDINNFKAIKVGAAKDGEPQPIRVNFSAVEIRNSVLSKGSSLPKGTKIEKCMPRRYRQKNREFVDYGWQVKQVRENVKTRVVFKGHLLVLEMRKLNDGDLKYDWTIVKEFCPEPETPTDKAEAHRTRVGLSVTQPLLAAEKNVVILSNLVIKEEQDIMAYFKTEFVQPVDQHLVSQVNAEKITKQMLIVTLPDRQACQDFCTKYKTIKFNGSEPRMSVLLGGTD